MLELHVRSHSTDRPFVCEHCDKTYKDAPSLYSHMQCHDAKRAHLCSECGASFMKADHLKRHINSTHRKIKTIKCTYCDMMFSDKYKAKIHERKHTGETPYLCDICSKGFKRKEALDNHAIVHKDLPKDFKCVTCGAAFNSQQYLNRHISRHFAEKKHKCRDCDKAFIDKRDYIVHISKVHGNHRPYGCSSCGMAYKTKQGLTTHLKSYPDGECVNVTRRSRGPNKGGGGGAAPGSTPAAEKPFPCTQCNKKFMKQARLDIHMKTHDPNHVPAPKATKSQQQQSQSQTTPQPTPPPPQIQTPAVQVPPPAAVAVVQAHPCPMLNCSSVFASTAILKNHIKEAHPDPGAAVATATATIIQPQTLIQKAVSVVPTIPSIPAMAAAQKVTNVIQQPQRVPTMLQQPQIVYHHQYPPQQQQPQHLRLQPQQAHSSHQAQPPQPPPHLEFYQHYAANFVNHMYHNNKN